MMSVFSEQAPRDLKVFYAFKIYGMNRNLNQTIGPIVRIIFIAIESEIYTISRHDIRIIRENYLVFVEVVFIDFLANIYNELYVVIQMSFKLNLI